MKRTVKAYVAVLSDGTLANGDRSPRIYFDAYDFENERLNQGNTVRPCTITYDDGTKTKRRRKPHA